ncbi:MAG TPA: hypothetical protein VFO16_11400 [Pseudonocardiaceae bacterium]|nr:hypothetical protein [Pseudonocardiaceae bacterium]
MGATPLQWLDGMAYFTQRMSTDAPQDDLRWEEEPYDAARLWARDASCLACGLHIVTTAGTPAGHPHQDRQSGTRPGPASRAEGHRHPTPIPTRPWPRSTPRWVSGRAAG